MGRERESTIVTRAIEEIARMDRYSREDAQRLGVLKGEICAK